MKNTWSIHQFFATKNRSISSIISGLNQQIEHHIPLNISCIHYDKIATILKNTTGEYNLPYHEFNPIIAHFKDIKYLGMKPSLIV